MTLTLISCERVDPILTVDKIMALAFAITLENGRPYPNAEPIAIFSGTPDARLIAGLLRRLAGDDDERDIPDRAGNGAGPGL